MTGGNQVKAIVIEHVGKVRRHGPKDQKGRGSDFRVSMSTKVWSNHFAAGYRSDQSILTYKKPRKGNRPVKGNY